MRLAYSLAFIGWLAASTSAAAGTPLPPGTPADKDALRGNVLVWQDAQLYTEPTATAGTLQLATFDGARKDRVGHVLALKVIRTAGGFVEVELTGQKDCTLSRVVVPDDLARVRLFVRRADLAPVLTKPFARTFADGTSISLAAGTPVLATDAGTYVVALRGSSLEVDIPTGSVGFSYASASSGKRATITVEDTLAIAPATRATLGERSIVLAAAPALPAAQAAMLERRGDQALVSLDAACAVAHVIVPSTSLADADEQSELSSSGGSDVMSLRDECFLPKLTPLSIGTRQVAIAAKPIYLHAEPMGDKACIQRAIKIESGLDIKATDDKLRMCAPAKKVLRDRMRSSARSAPG